jgi:ABC-2 type transport system permease protein
MNEIWIVAWREFRQKVRKRGFLLTSIGTPVILIVIWAFTGAFSGGTQAPVQDLTELKQLGYAVGYVEHADLIRSIPDSIPTDRFRAYPDVQAAAAALKSGAIGAYYVIPADYVQTGVVRRISPTLPTGAPPDVQSFDWILVANLFPGETSEEIARLRQPLGAGGPKFVSVSAGGETGTASSALPFVVAFVVMIPLFTSGSYLFQSLSQEKGSRVIEFLLTSLRPRQLLGGKLLGLGALAMVQYVIWAAIGLLAATLFGRGASQLLNAIQLSAGEVALLFPYALGGYGLYAAVMAGLGALSPDIESSRGWVFLLTLPMLLPVYLWTAIASSPNGVLAVALSLIPFSAPVAMLMRMTSTTVPVWQIGSSLALLAVATVAVIWLMARLFRVQTLLSGEKFSIGRMWADLKG